ncbi:MAG: aspartate 1-decarboxylase [bacterium]|nr:aspartate 1-decarboxylase [bacterium]
MYRTMLKSKLHGAIVTECNLHYEGSISIDENLIKAADLLPGELVHVLNINNAERFETYVIKAKAGSGTIGLNGAAARLVQVGDELILLAYGQYSPEELKQYKPVIIHLDKKNRILRKK